MKKHKIRLNLLIGLLVLAACSNVKDKSDGNPVYIHGLLNEGNGKKVYVQKVSSTGFITLDSMKVEKNNRFAFNINVEYPGFYGIKNEGGNHISFVCHGNDTVEIIANYFVFKDYQLKGSEELEQIVLLNKKTQDFLDEIDVYARITNDSIGSPNYARIKTDIDKKYKAAYADIRGFSRNFISRNQKSLVSLLALTNQLGPRFFVFHPINDMEIFETVDSTLFSLYPETEPVRNLHLEVASLKSQLRAQKMQQSGLKTGDIAPEIRQPDPGGKMISLSSTRGKIVLVDFWASWCPPCRRANPDLRDIYRDFQDRGFEIFQVSLDKSAEKWKKAIVDDSLTWINVSDLEYWDSEPAGKYDVKSIPASFLLDKDGSIISMNPGKEELRNQLDSLLNP